MNTEDALLARTLAALLPQGQVVELRAPDAEVGRNFAATLSGYYDDAAKLVADAVGVVAPGVYFTLNPVDPRLLARRSNRLKPLSKRDASAGDKDILARRLLFVEVDPERPSGICATDAEKVEARSVAAAVAEHLRAAGWPDPIEIDSGNGHYLLYRVDLPTDDGGLVERCLRALAERFNTATAHIDTAVFNPSRIARLPGSLNRKGDNTTDRPHRPCRVLSAPEDFQSVPRQLLDELAASAALVGDKNHASGAATTTGEYGHRLLVPKYLAHYGVDVLSTNTGDQGQTRWRVTCPFNPAHTSTDAYAFQYPSGAVGFFCSHNSCAGKAWPAFKDAIGQPLAGHFDPPMVAAKPVTGTFIATDTNAETPPLREPEWPEQVAEEAFHGLAGEIVSVLDPGSEADRVAVLAQVLVMFGNLIGRRPHYRVSGSYHRGNLFVVLVGPTAAGRKGTSYDMARMAFTGVEDDWLTGRVVNGLSSGEGALWAIRDPIMKRVEVKQRGSPSTFEEVETDPGVPDKRLLVQEPEFANVLKQMERQGNTLSVFLRQAWDSPPVLQTLTKNNPARSSDPHVSMIGHITGVEFTRCLTSTEAANGGANRNLVLCVRRSKELPYGGSVDEAKLNAVRQKLKRAVGFARTVDEVKHERITEPLWKGVYKLLTDGSGGLHGALTARAAPQVLRLAMVYALLDCKRTVGPAHLMAALALWDYADRSTSFLFADRTGNPLADEIRDLLRTAPTGMTRTQIQAALGKHQYGDRLTQALLALELAKLARREKEPTSGRAAERWRATLGAGVESVLLTTARKLYEGCGISGESGGSPPPDDPSDTFTAYAAYTAVRPTDWKELVLKHLSSRSGTSATAQELHEAVNREVPTATAPPILADIEEALAELVDGRQVEAELKDTDTPEQAYRLPSVDAKPSFPAKTSRSPHLC